MPVELGERSTLLSALRCRGHGGEPSARISLALISSSLHNMSSPVPGPSTSETGNKPASGPAADAPKAQGTAPSQDYTNPLMQNQVLDPHVVTMMAGQRWYSKVYDPPSD